MHEGSAKTWLPSKGVAPLFKATLPTCVLNRCGLSLLQHAPRFSSPPHGAGAGSHTSCKPVRGRRSQTAARAVHATTRRLQALLHFRPDQRVKGRTAMQAACNRAKWACPLRLQHAQHRGPGPRVMQPACRLLRASNCTATRATTTPPRLRSQYRDSRQPCSASQARRTNAVKNGPAVMAVTGGQEQRSRREDGAPVIRSSNGSHTRNDRLANRSPRHINSTAGQAAPQAGEASDASPSP
jgi:hypothetical protein